MQNVTVYLVGGAVRDQLLGLDSRDRDYVVVGSTPAEMLASGFTQVGASFPVFLHPGTGDEYALARTERKTGVGYHGFETFYDRNVTLEEDLARRDLTINSMAMGADGVLVDPFGGEADLNNGILRHTSQAFADDPLRVLRLARFSARYGFAVAPETMLLARQLVAAGELLHLPRERIWTELAKGFAEKDPSGMLHVLSMAGALDVAPLVDYFGQDFNVGITSAFMRLSSELPHDCNQADLNALFTLKHVVDQSDQAFNKLRIPNLLRDAIRLEKKLSNALLNPLTPESVYNFFNSTRFVTDSDSNAMKLALHASLVTAMLKLQLSFWKQNLNRVQAAADAIRGLDMVSVVNTGDPKTVKFRVDSAKFNAVKALI